MTSKDLLEVFVLACSAGFTFASYLYSSKITNLTVKIEAQNLENNQRMQQYIFENTRKIQKNIDANTVEIGKVKCDVRDIKGVLQKEKLLHDRVEFPQENIPRRTGWTVEDA